MMETKGRVRMCVYADDKLCYRHCTLPAVSAQVGAAVTGVQVGGRIPSEMVRLVGKGPYHRLLPWVWGGGLVFLPSGGFVDAWWQREGWACAGGTESMLAGWKCGRWWAEAGMGSGLGMKHLEALLYVRYAGETRGKTWDFESEDPWTERKRGIHVILLHGIKWPYNLEFNVSDYG